MDRRKYKGPEKRHLVVPEQPLLQPLIPQHIVDHASQRHFAISIFAAIQCWKIYDILLVKAEAYAIAKLAAAAGTSAASKTGHLPSFTSLNNFTFVLKYAFIDGLFLWALPFFNIPLLSFLPLLTLLLTAAINSFNFVLTSNSALPLLLNTFVPLWNLFNKQKELTILGDSVAPQKLIDMNLHFRGKYTIQFLPESSATLNPFGFKDLCLESRDLGSYTFPASIKLPIEFNTTSDVGEILLRRVTPENTVEFLNYTRPEIRKLAKKDYSVYAQLPGYVSNDDRVFYLDANIKHPGIYSIHKVLDVDGMVIRAYKKEFIIGHCPSAKFVYTGPESTYSGYKCISQNVADLSWSVPMVSAFGMLPVTVQLATYQNGQKINTFEQTISDSAPKEKEGPTWLQSSLITRNSLEQGLLKAPENFKNVGLGTLEFQLLSVSDTVGNKRLYNDKSKDKDVNFPIELKLAPSFTLRDKHPARKLVLKLSKMLYVESKGSASFPVKVTLAHEKEGTPSKVEKLEFTFKSKEEFLHGLQITEPGKYFLLSGSDKYCPCHADLTPIHIVRPPLPAVKIKDVLISDKCVGTIGVEFDLFFQGTPPFEISYEVMKNTSGVLRPVLSDRGLKLYQKKSLKNELRFDFKPTHEGNYVLVFKHVKDLHYNQDAVPVSAADNTFVTQIKKKSQFVLFKDAHAKVKTIYLCKDQETEIPVHFEGHFPFSYTWDVVDSQSGKVVSSQSRDNEYQSSVLIQIPKFTEEGEYTVRFKDVTDKLGCAADFPFDQQIKIKARKDTPLVEIAESATSHIVEGDAFRIPLNIESSSGRSADDNIVYLWMSLYDAKNTKNYTLHGKSALVVKEEGIYRLESYANAGCSGTVKNSGRTFALRYHARPSLSVVPNAEQLISKTQEIDVSGLFSLKPLCQDDVQRVRIRLHGKKPFVVNYEIKFPSGRAKTSLLHIDNDEIMLPLLALRAGTYTISFNGVFDALYSGQKAQRLAHKQTTSVVTYDVKAHPGLKVQESNVQVCETKVKDDFDLKIIVSLDGVAPFKVEGEIVSGPDSAAKPFLVENLRASVISLKDLNIKGSYSDVFSVGEHLIRFTSVSDASQCKSVQLLEANQMQVSVTKVPSIVKRDLKQYYCVGDRISYNMSGVSPFVVYYKFNDQNRKAELKGDFTRLATKPGELAIVALQDSAVSQCLVNFTKNEQSYDRLKLQVHDLPSVEISHGDSIIKNLHEGDQSEITFKFIGTPPFSMTYVRTLGDDDGQHRQKRGSKVSNRGRRHVVESKTVANIWEHEYSALVNLEGTYEAIEVTDAFCAARRDVQEIL